MAPELDFEGGCRKDGVHKSSENGNITKSALALAFGAVELFSILGHQNFQSFLKSPSWSNTRVEKRLIRKGYRVVSVVEKSYTLWAKISTLNCK